MEAVIVALIVGALGIFGQWLLKRQDFRRQDEVAERVAEVASQARQAYESTATQLHKIHVLVNANLTAAQQRELEATRAMLVQMREVIDLKQKLNIGIEPNTHTVLTDIQRRIDELAIDLTHKQAQTRLADDIE